MSMLKKTDTQPSFAKVGLYGDPGSGKTFTAACIAIGLHRQSQSTKPIAFFDTENGSEFVKPLFKAFGIDLYTYKGHSLSELMKYIDEAEKECFSLLIDSVTHIWRDVQRSYIDKINLSRKHKNMRPIEKLEFHHWEPIKKVWGTFTNKFIYSNLHIMLCGRASQIYEYQLNDQSGKRELITNGTKMSTEKEMGYEPNLLIEMIKHTENGRLNNRAIIEKDRTNFLNGDVIDFEPFKGIDPDKILNVYKKFTPHFNCLNFVGEKIETPADSNSMDLYPDIEVDGFPKEVRQRTRWSEEIQGILISYYPGQTAQEKKTKTDLLEMFFNSRSWKHIEENIPSEQLKDGYLSLRDHLFSINENTDTIKLIDENLLKDLELLINNDDVLKNNILKQYNVDHLSKINETQYICIRDELRIMSAKIEVKPESISKVA